MEINSGIGSVLLDAYPEMKVDVHTPQIMLNIEIREKNLYLFRSNPRPRGNARRDGRESDAAFIGGH